MTISSHLESPQNEQMKDCLAYVKQLVASTWTPLYQKEGITASTCTLPGQAMPATRGDVELVEKDIYEVFGTYYVASCRPQWDDRTELATQKEYLSDNNTIAARDVVAVTTPIFYDAELDALVLLQQSLAESTKPLCKNAYPEVKGMVRAQLMATAVIAKRTNGSALSRVGNWTVSYICHGDAKGSLPTSIVALVSQQQPLGLARLVKFIETKGSLVKAMDRDGVSILSENVDTKSYEYKGEFVGTAVGGQCKFLISSTLFATGADVTVQGPATIVRQDNDLLLTIDQVNVPVKVSVSKSNGSSFVIKVNGLAL